MSDVQVAKISVPSIRIREIVAERRSSMWIRLIGWRGIFGMPASFWINLKSNYELAVAYKHSQWVLAKEVLSREAPAG